MGTRRTSRAARAISSTLAGLVREGRAAFGWSQQELATRAGVGRSTVATIEAAGGNVSLDVAGRLLDALDIRPTLSGGRPALIDGPRGRDIVHAWCVAFVARRLAGLGWLVRTEVEIVDGRLRGWIDVLAFHPASGRLLIIEIKSLLQDVGGAIRQVLRYEAFGLTAARQLGWRPRHATSWLLVLATDAADIAIRENDGVLREVFPDRAQEMQRLVAQGDGTGAERRGLGLIDPGERAPRWILPSSRDARRVIRRRFRGYGDAAQHVAGLWANRPRARRRGGLVASGDQARRS